MRVSTLNCAYCGKPLSGGDLPIKIEWKEQSGGGGDFIEEQSAIVHATKCLMEFKQKVLEWECNNGN
jgi:hypothetical protein